MLTELTRLTGAKRLVFVTPLDGEGTHHLDIFMNLVDRYTVVVGQYGDSTTANAKILDANAEALAKVTTEGNPLRVVRIPMPPDPQARFLNYTNVVFANGVLLVPSWKSAPAELEKVSPESTKSYDLVGELSPSTAVKWLLPKVLCIASLATLAWRLSFVSAQPLPRPKLPELRSSRSFANAG